MYGPSLHYHWHLNHSERLWRVPPYPALGAARRPSACVRYENRYLHDAKGPLTDNPGSIRFKRIENGFSPFHTRGLSIRRQTACRASVALPLKITATSPHAGEGFVTKR